MMKNTITKNLLVSFLFLLLTSCIEQEYKLPHPEKNPQSSIMLKGSWVPENPHDIDFNNLHRIKSEHSVVSDVRGSNGVNQHNYLIYYKNKYWIMWSDGPGVEDRVGQRVAYATSTDGLKWSKKQFITPFPKNSNPDSPIYNSRDKIGFRYISRGFWNREGELLALVSLDEADKFFGPSLELRAFRLDPKNETWKDIGLVYDNTINNFPPKLMPNGEWMMTRRTHDRNVYTLTGGTKRFDQWETHPVIGQGENELIPEEPYWWVLSDGNLLALFRDNGGSGFLFRAFSTDQGRTWTKPVRTDFPDARSKFNGLQLRDGRFVLVSNPNPKKRDPLTISISADGIIFTEMAYLIGDRHVDYPHIIERKGYLLVAFSGAKQSVEVLKFKISELDNLDYPPMALPNKPILFIDKHKVEFNPNNGVDIYYTTDGSMPSNKSKLYNKPFYITKSTTVNLVGVSADEEVGSSYKIRYLKKTSIEPISLENVDRGLQYDYFEFQAQISLTADLENMQPISTGIIEKIDFPKKENKFPDNFGIIFNGYIKIPNEGIYTFNLLSNDGSCLYISDQIVVDNDGNHGGVEKEGDIALKMGLHKIQLLYFQAGGGKTLKLYMKERGGNKIEVQDEILVH